MEVMAERRHGVVLIRVSGRIDGSNAAEFDSAVSAAIEDDDHDVLMDLETISYIATAGLRTFARVARKLRVGNARLALCAMPDQGRRVLEITGFDRVIPTFPSRTEALAFLARERSARTRDDVATTGVTKARPRGSELRPSPSRGGATAPNRRGRAVRSSRLDSAAPGA